MELYLCLIIISTYAYGSQSLVVEQDNSWADLYRSLFLDNNVGPRSVNDVDKTLTRLEAKLTQGDEIPTNQSVLIRFWNDAYHNMSPKMCSGEYMNSLKRQSNRNLELYRGQVYSKLVTFCNYRYQSSFQYVLHSWSTKKTVNHLTDGHKLIKPLSDEELANRLFDIMSATKDYLRNIFKKKYMNSIHLDKNVMTFKRHYFNVCPCVGLFDRKDFNLAYYEFLREPEVYVLLTDNVQRLVDQLNACEIIDKSTKIHQTALNKILESI